MQLHQLAAAAALALGALSAQAAITHDQAALGAGATVVDFESYDGLWTSGPELIAPGITFTGDAGSELGANNRDLGENGIWGVGNRFAASGTIGELRFTFDALSNGAGAWVNHYAFPMDLVAQYPSLPSLSVVVSAYGDNNQIIETYTYTVATTWDSYDDGIFLGITRDAADIRSISFKGVGVVVDNFTMAAPVPEPETYAMLLAGLAAIGTVARRRRRG